MTPSNCAIPAAPAPATPETAFSGAGSIAQRLRSLAVRPQGVTVEEIIDRYMRRYAGRDNTMVARLSAWRSMIGEFTLEAIDSDLIHACRNELQSQPALAFKGLDHAGNKIFKTKGRAQPKSGATLNRYMVAMSGVFTWAIEERLTPRGWTNPCRGIKRMKDATERVRFLDPDERTRLFDACKQSGYPRLYALSLTAMLTGARKGELLGLRWADLDLTEGIATLGRSKNGDRRTLVLLPQVIEALQPFQGDPARFVFGSVRTKYQTPASIDSAFRDAVSRAQIKNFKFHDHRHCCASYMAQAGKPLNVIAEVLGHRKLDMTRRYAHLTTQTKAQAMRAALGEIK